MNETTQLLLDHMSIRSYLDKPVQKEMVDTIVACAQSAPTSTHFQSYTIIEVTDPEKKKALAGCGGGSVGLFRPRLSFCSAPTFTAHQSTLKI
jgi:nitroreductase